MTTVPSSSSHAPKERIKDRRADGGEASLSRALLMRDGRCKTIFTDGTWIVLEASGACFTFYDPKAFVPCERGMSRFVRHKQAHKLALALDFRNAHSSDAPFWCKALDRALTRGWTSEVRVETARWTLPLPPPPSATEGSDDPSGDFVAPSSDGRCELRLSPNGHWFAVTYPLLCQTTTTTEGDPRDTTFHYRFQRHFFSVEDCPLRWRQLLNAAQRHVAGLGSSDSSSTTPDDVQGILVDLPTAHSLEGEAGASWVMTPASSFWDTESDVLYPRDVPVSLEWTPYALYHFAFEENEVDALVFWNNSVLRSFESGKYFKHYRERNSSGPMDLIKPVVRTPPDRMDDLGTMKETTVVGFYNGMIRYAHNFLGQAVLVKKVVLHKAYTANAKALAASVSNKVVCDVFDADIGTMVAYEDRRVWIKFIDHAFLELDQDHRMCKVTLPKGDTRIVRATKAVGVEEYAEVALQFAAWAFQSPLERDEQIELHASIQAAMDATQRMKTMIDIRLGRMPQGKTAQVGG